MAVSAPVIWVLLLMARSPEAPPKMLERSAELAMMLVLDPVPDAWRMAPPALITTGFAPALIAPRVRSPDAHRRKRPASGHVDAAG